MAHDRIVSEHGITTRKDEAKTFVTDVNTFVSETESPIKKIDSLAIKYEVQSVVGEARGGGKTAADITGQMDDKHEALIKDLDETMEEYVKIETTSVRILNRAEELQQLTSLTASYLGLITDSSTSDSGFASRLAGIRREQASKIPSLVEKQLQSVAKDVKQAMQDKLPELLTEKEIEALLREKYSDVLSDEQLPMLAKVLFENCNTVDVNVKGNNYTLSIDKNGNYFINNKQVEKSEFDVLFGSFSTSKEVKKGDFNSDLNIFEREGGETEWGNSDFGTITFGANAGLEAAMLTFMQNGVPLISSGDGKIKAIRNTQLDFGKVYADVGANTDIKGTRTKIAISAEIGADLVTVDSEVLSFPLPLTDFNVVINGSLGLGAKAEGKFQLDRDNLKIKAGGGAGGTASGEIGFERKDYETNTIADFDF